MFPSAGKPGSAFLDASVQTLPPSVLAAKRAHDLHELLQRVGGARDCFYSARWLDGARAPGASGASLAALAITTGADLVDEATQHPPFGRLQLEPGHPIRTGLARAAVPRPLPIYWTRADLDAEAVWGARALWRAGVRPRSRTSDCLDGGLITPGTLAITDALDCLDALALPVGTITTDAALERAREVWDIVQPACLIVDGATFAFLDAHPRRPPCTMVLVLGPPDRALLQQPARADLFRILSLPQIGSFVAGECAAHDGYHLAEDAVTAEIVDADDQPLPDEQLGKLLLTTLTRNAVVLRFDTTMRASLTHTVCGCGETHARLMLP